MPANVDERAKPPRDGWPIDPRRRKTILAGLKVTRGWHPEAFALRESLRAVSRRHPRGQGECRLAEGAADWVQRTGRGLGPGDPWWSLALGVAAAVSAAIADPGSRALLAPWAGLQPHAPDNAPGFEPVAPDAGA